jgi:hypothetical protein
MKVILKISWDIGLTMLGALQAGRVSMDQRMADASICISKIQTRQFDREIYLRLRNDAGHVPNSRK